jgi:hypothetical protein
VGEAKWERAKWQDVNRPNAQRTMRGWTRCSTPADACGMRTAVSLRCFPCAALSARFLPAHLHVTAVHACPRALPGGCRVLRTVHCTAWPERRSLPAREHWRHVPLRCCVCLRSTATVSARRERLASRMAVWLGQFALACLPAQVCAHHRRHAERLAQRSVAAGRRGKLSGHPPPACVPACVPLGTPRALEDRTLLSTPRILVLGIRWASRMPRCRARLGSRPTPTARAQSTFMASTGQANPGCATRACARAGTHTHACAQRSVAAAGDRPNPSKGCRRGVGCTL